MRSIRVVFTFLTILALSSCSSSTPTSSTPTSPGNPVTPAAATLVYIPYVSAVVSGGVVTSASSSIVAFPANSSGAVSPASTLTSQNTTDQYSSVATDSSGNIYVGSTNLTSTVGKISVFAAGSTGAANPIATITGSATGMATAYILAVDSSQNVYVAGTGTVLEFAANANGNVAPIRTLTGLPACKALAVDPAGNIVYAVATGAANADSIEIFTPTQSGNAAPARTISTASNLLHIAGMGLDTAGNIYVANEQYPVSTPVDESILEFPGGVPAGSGTGIGGIEGVPGLAGLYLTALEVDAAGNIYVLASDGIGNGYLSKWFAGSKGMSSPVQETSHMFAQTNGPMAVH